MELNFRQPKYMLPLLALPFLCLFFYAWHSTFSKPAKESKPEAGLNGSVGDVSSVVRKKELADKLDAYRSAYKDADGRTAVSVIPRETSSNASFHDNYNDKERKTLDSIDKAIKAKYSRPTAPDHDRALATALNEIPVHQKRPAAAPEPREKDPMEIFRQQMTYLDSVNKENDPAAKAERLKKEAADRTARQKLTEVKFTVVKADGASDDFNTVMPKADNNFIMAAIDGNVTGYAGSRLRLRLLEDIKAGKMLIGKGSYVYAMISGFSGQRVTLAITSILCSGKILPVKLEVYDLDGLPGLYVPSSAFRDFTKNLGSNSVQGVSIDGNSGGSQFIMSSLDKVFQSTSSAIADLIRKNKAKMKYNSYVYLIDNDVLQNAQKSY